MSKRFAACLSRRLAYKHFDDPKITVEWRKKLTKAEKQNSEKIQIIDDHKNK